MAQLAEINIDQIQLSPTSHRDIKNDDPAFLELADSIAKNGIINAIAVRPGDPDPVTKQPTFLLVDGTQRFGAAKMARLKTVPASILDLSDVQTWAFQVMGNAVRVPDKKTELAKTLQRILDVNPTATKAQLAEMNSKSVKWVEDTLSLNRLIPKAAELTDAGRITASNAIQLAKLPAEEQENLLDSAQTDDTALFTTIVGTKAKELKEAKKTGGPRPEPTFVANPALRKMTELVDELNSGKVLRSTVTSSTDPFEAFRMGMQYCMSIDSATVAVRKAEWEAHQAKIAADKETRRQEREANKAKAEQSVAA